MLKMLSSGIYYDIREIGSSEIRIFRAAASIFSSFVNLLGDFPVKSLNKRLKEEELRPDKPHNFFVSNDSHG